MVSFEWQFTVNKWYCHRSNDFHHLNRGFLEYGTPSDDPSAAAWSVKWGLDEFNEFLFASGNLKYFLRATKRELIGDDGLKEYVDQPIQILSSYLSCDVSEGI